MQAERDKALNEMHPAAMERAGYWFREASDPRLTRSGRAARPGGPHRGREICRHLPRSCRAHPGRGGLPARLDFGPPEPEIVEALVNGTSPILRELDQRREVVAGSAPSSL